MIIGETSLGVVVAFISGFQRLADPLRELIGFYRLAASKPGAARRHCPLDVRNLKNAASALARTVLVR